MKLGHATALKKEEPAKISTGGTLPTNDDGDNLYKCPAHPKFTVKNIQFKDIQGCYLCARVYQNRLH